MWRILFALACAVPILYITTLTTTIYLHRGLTHGSLEFHPALDLAIRFYKWIQTGLIRREWVAVHRKHHAHTDEEGDPHSPYQYGVWKVTFANVKYYRRETQNPETVKVYAKDIKRDWFDNFFDHSLVGIALGITIWCFIFGLWAGIIAFAVHGVAYVFLSGAINGLGHSDHHGYRNWPNTARNLRWLAWLTGGEGLHNNHHGAQRSPKLSMAPGESDPAWWAIRVLAWIGLIKIKGKTIDLPRRGAIANDPPNTPHAFTATH